MHARTTASTVVLLAAAALSAQPQSDVWRAELATEAVHPCLMFGPADVSRVKQRLSRKPYAGWWASVRASGNMVSRAFTWLMTGDVEAAEAARQRLLRANPMGYHCSCGVAVPLQACAEAYDLLYHYKGLTQDDHRIIRRKIAEACERMVLSALESGAGQHPGNQRMRGICALGTATIVLCDYRDGAHTPVEWLQRTLDGIRQEANLAFWRDDGMFIEGPGYSSFTLSIMVPFARYYERATGSWLFDDPRLRNALIYLTTITQPDGLCAAIGTTNAAGVVARLRLCIGAGEPRMQSLSRWAIEQWSSLSGGGVRDIGLFDDTAEPAVSGFHTTRFYPVTQEAHIRNEWSRNAVALWFKGKDPWLARTHRVYSHGDVGSFVLHAYGELLAVDAGYDHWVSYNLYPPELHNTLLVDGNGPQNETSGLLENTIDAGFIQAGDIVWECGSVRNRRTFAMVAGDYAVIADDIRAGAPHDYAWQIHTPVTRSAGEITVAGTRASWTGFDPRSDAPGDVRLEAVWAGPVALTPMPKSRWQPFSADPKTGSYDNWALVAKQTAADARYLTVLYPHLERVPPPTIETPQIDGAQCIVVRHGAVTDTSLALETDSARFGRVRTTARTCVVRERDGALEFFYLSTPGTLDYDGDRVVDRPEEGVGCVTGKAVDRDGTVQIASVPDSEGPPWQAGPRVEAVTVDGRDLPARERTDLGRVVDPPQAISVRFAGHGASSRVAPETLRVTLDGLRLPPERATWDGTRAVVRPGAVQGDGLHEVLVRVAEQDEPSRWGQFLLSFSSGPMLLNGGFERGGSAATGWGLGAWSSNAETRYESKAVGDRPHSGNQCLMMKGIAGALNMVASQRVPVVLGKTYVLRGYYRGDVPAAASFCSQSGKNQYVRSPGIGPAADWTPFEWEFTVENPEDRLIVALRLGRPGTVYFDDVSLTEKPMPSGP